MTVRNMSNILLACMRTTKTRFKTESKEIKCRVVDHYIAYQHKVLRLGDCFSQVGWLVDLNVCFICFVIGFAVDLCNVIAGSVL